MGSATPRPGDQRSGLSALQRGINPETRYGARSVAVDGGQDFQCDSLPLGGLRSRRSSTTLRPMQTPLSYRHRVITEDDLVFIRKLIADHPSASRKALSRKLCEAWNWVQANGAPRDMVCRGLMLMLHREGLIELPPARPSVFDQIKRGRPSLVSVDEAPLQMSLAELGPLEVRQVRRTPEEALFNSLLQQHHYLGYTQPVGEHLKYLVRAQGRPVACLAWSSAPRHLGSRDRFIGWDPQARLKNIGLLAYNTRFLILPWVTVPHLASNILGRMTRMLS